MKKGINESVLKGTLGEASTDRPFTIAGIPALILNGELNVVAMKGLLRMNRNSFDDNSPVTLTTRSGGIIPLREDVDMLYHDELDITIGHFSPTQSTQEAWSSIEEITCSLYPNVPSSFFSMEPPFDRDQVFTFHTLLDEGVFLTGDVWKVYTGELETCNEITMVQVNPYKDVDINTVKGACNIAIHGDHYVRFLGRNKQIIYVDEVETKVVDNLIHVVNPPSVTLYPVEIESLVGGPYYTDPVNYNHTLTHGVSDGQLNPTPIKPNGDTIKIVGTEVLRSKQPGCMHVKLSIQFNDKIEECGGIFEYGGGNHFNAELRLNYESWSYKVDAKVIVATCGISEVTITNITR